MFNKLYNLYKNANKNTPLEDFNTECFVGLLNNYSVILKAFTKYIGLKGDTYKILTQVTYPLQDNGYCKPDIVIRNENTICFIESKVDSTEGYKQLEKYSLALKLLDNFQDENKHLIYCTKNYDPKSHLEGKYQFRQKRWFEISHFLTQYKELPMVSDYITFLEHQDMVFNPSITGDILITQKHLVHTLKISKYYLNIISEVFKNNFPNSELKINPHPKEQLYKWNRRVNLTTNIIPDSKYTEMLFGILYDTSEFICQIYVERKIDKYDQLKGLMEEKLGDHNEFFIENHDKDTKGTSFAFKIAIGNFKGDNEEKEILEWFERAFVELGKFIISTSQLNWKIDVVQIDN